MIFCLLSSLKFLTIKDYKGIFLFPLNISLSTLFLFISFTEDNIKIILGIFDYEAEYWKTTNRFSLSKAIIHPGMYDNILLKITSFAHNKKAIAK